MADVDRLDLDIQQLMDVIDQHPFDPQLKKNLLELKAQRANLINQEIKKHETNFCASTSR
jgi:hypothetical protein